MRQTMHVHVVSLPEGEEVGPVKVGPVDKQNHIQTENTSTQVNEWHRSAELAMVTRLQQCCS